MSPYVLFIEKLNDFISKYYRNILFKGILLSLSLLLISFLLFNFIEYFAFLPSCLRFILLLIFILLFLFCLVQAVIIPFLRMKGWIKRMDYMQAAHYLALRYPELDDRLYNVLELQNKIDGDILKQEGPKFAISQEGKSEKINKLEKSSAETNQLLQAAIEQITSNFVSYKFTNVIKLKANLKYLKILGIPLMVFLLILIFYPQSIWKPSQRILRYNEVFAREFPFTIQIQNEVLKVPYEQDFLLRLYVKGSQLPSEIQLAIGDRLLTCKKKDANHFTYLFKSVQEPISFNIVSGKYKSNSLVLLVLQKPLLSSIQMILNYPSYTGKGREVIDNTLDAVVPVGTKIQWKLRVDYAKELRVNYINSPITNTSNSKWKSFTVHSKAPLFSFSAQAKESFVYTLIPTASMNFKTDTLKFHVEVIPDTYPRIDVIELMDSTMINRRFFQGRIADDYGFHSLIFHVKCYKANTAKVSNWTDGLELISNSRDQEFRYYLDVHRFSLEPGDELNYYFEVRDNDAAAGFKSMVSKTFSYKKMSEQEVRTEVKTVSEAIENKLSSSIIGLRKFSLEFEKNVKKLLEKKQFHWEDKKGVEQLLEQQKKLMKEYQKIAQELQQKNDLEKELNEYSQEVLQKQKELQELYEKVFDKQTLEKLEELQRLMEENAPQDRIMESFEKLKQEQRDLKKDLDRNLDLYRQLEFEKRMEKSVEDAQKLLNNTQDLNKSLQKDFLEKRDSIKAVQQELNKKFENLKKDLSDLEKLNSTLDKPSSFIKPEDLLQKIDKASKNAEFEIGEKNKKEADTEQKKAIDAMQELAENLSMQKEKIEKEKEAEDAEAIRILLKSIVRVSFKQENIMQILSSIRITDPRYVEVIRRQSELKTEIQFIADSITAISRRQPQVALVTNKEVADMLNYSKEALNSLLSMNNVAYQRYSINNSEALGKQQYAMTSLNNLALLLSESLDKMEEKKFMGKGSSSMKNRGKPQGSCSNPGGGKPKAGSSEKKPSIQQMQEALNKQLEALKKGLEKQAALKGNESGKGQKGGNEGDRNSGIRDANGEFSEAFSRAAMQQEMIRRRLQEKVNEAKIGDAKTAGEFNKILGDMERTEKDLVNKILNNQTLLRQQNIESRLLEAENAELNREQTEKRESKEGDLFTPDNKIKMDFFKKKDKGQGDVLQKSTPSLRPYYKEKVEKYFFE